MRARLNIAARHCAVTATRSACTRRGLGVREAGLCIRHPVRLQVHSYRAHTQRGSDHKPVSARFTVNVLTTVRRRRRRRRRRL